MKKNVTISIDDLHPKKDWGCDGDLSVAFLKNLWKEFGCKFTLFIPSNYHGKYPLSKHKDWVDFWRNQEWVELAAHGHFHLCERDDIGECEFFELDTDGPPIYIADTPFKRKSLKPFVNKKIYSDVKFTFNRDHQNVSYYITLEKIYIVIFSRSFAA